MCAHACTHRYRHAYEHAHHIHIYIQFGKLKAAGVCIIMLGKYPQWARLGCGSQKHPLEWIGGRWGGDGTGRPDRDPAPV